MKYFELRQLSVYDGIDIYNMLQRIGPSENAFNNDAYGLDFDHYKMWLIEKDAWCRGEMLPKGYVRQWVYWLFVDDIPVGFGKLRERVTEESLQFGGNIGFAIDSLQRGKGYGSRLFELLLNVAKEKNISKIFSTVEKPNHPSKRVHEKMGGRLIKEDSLRWYYQFTL